MCDGVPGGHWVVNARIVEKNQARDRQLDTPAQRDLGRAPGVAERGEEGHVPGTAHSWAEVGLGGAQAPLSGK